MGYGGPKLENPRPSVSRGVEECVSYCLSRGVENFILALPFAVTNSEIARFLALAEVSGIIVPEFAAVTTAGIDGTVGRFVSEADWTLPRSKAQTLAYVGPMDTLRVRMAWIACRRMQPWGACTWTGNAKT